MPDPKVSSKYDIQIIKRYQVKEQQIDDILYYYII